MKLISVISPCYNEKENIMEMYARVKRVFTRLRGVNFELIYIDNGSHDGSEKVYERLAKKDKRVKVILMSRNFGSPQPSYIAGLRVARGDAAALMHGDIQDPPELIPKLMRAMKKGYDVVYGIRTNRKGYSAFMNMLYKAFYWLFAKMSYVKTPMHAGEFSLINRRVIDELVAIGEYDYYLRFLRAYVGFKQTGVEYERDDRAHGESTQNILASLSWAQTFIVNFSFLPLEWISTVAFGVMLLTVFLFIGNFALVLVNPMAPRGVPTIVLLILFLGAIQLLSLSVIAQYLAKIFLEVKGRPRYIVRKTLNIRGRKQIRRDE